MAATVSFASQALPLLPTKFDVGDESEKSNRLQRVETKFKSYVLAMRIRLVDLFADFDKLRSGLVTTSQFRRAVAAAMEKGIVSPLREDEIDVLQEHYAKPGTNSVYWRKFVDSINTAFDKTPSLTSAQPFRRPLSPSSEEAVEQVIKHIKSYVKHHGSDVKSWFKDFDKYNNGYVTYNQFTRGIPQNLLSQEEQELLVARYGEAVTGTVNYFKMNTDVNRKAPRPTKDNSHLVAKHKHSDWYDEHVPVGTEELLHTTITTFDDNELKLGAIEEKIKKFAYKNRIRLLEFFRDYDRHNSGLITESQFQSGLILAKVPVEGPEISVLVSSYQMSQGRVAYRKFCNSIDTVFTINDLEKNPLTEVTPPSRDWLIRGSNDLSPQEEERCVQIIQRLRDIVKQRRPLLTPFFKDFDRHLGNIGRVTRSHFSRLLSMVDLPVNDDDLHLLFRKYEDRAQGKVNYMAFIRAIDPETYTSKRPNDTNSSKKKEVVESKQLRPVSSSTGTARLLTRIKNYVGTRRVRVAEFFKDFDKLRSYSIRKEEFIRGLSSIGMKLLEEELEHLAIHYIDKTKKGYCRWKSFADDIDRVFADSLPNGNFKEGGIKQRPSPFVMARQKLEPEEEALLQQTLQRIRSHMKLRQMTVKPFFRDFDRAGVVSGTGHVTKSQFRQCLTFMKCDVTDEEFEVLCKKWTKSPSGIEGDTVISETGEKKDYIKDVGENICYVLFLEELEAGMNADSNEPAAIEPTRVPLKPLIAKKEPLAMRPIKENQKLFDEDEFLKLMMRIKIKAKTTRIRVIDFMSDFDRLRHGRISKNEFRRALKVVFEDLTEADLKMLEIKYQSQEDSSRVNYVDFCDEVESVFTKKGLIRDPTADVPPFHVYSNGWSADPSVNILTREEGAVLEQVLNRLKAKVEARRIDALSYMEDYDFVNEGTITTNQFRSVLNSMGMYISDEEMRVFTKRFATNKSMTRINYRALSSITI